MSVTWILHFEINYPQKLLISRGREYQPERQPERVCIHDFPDPQRGKICSYGVYDPRHNRGWVSVGIDHDTAQFAVESIRR